MSVKSATEMHKSVFGSLRNLMHLIAAVQFGYGIYYDVKYVKFPESAGMHNPFGGKFKYLTFLDAIIQTIYFTISLVNDFFGTNEVAPKKVPLIRKLKDYIFAAFAFPIALNVCISFWALYAIDRELVFPKVLDAVFPSWLNHIMHTNIVVFIVLELFTSFREFPKRKSCVTGLSCFMLIYLIWIHIIKHYSGFWVYPVLKVLDLPQRILFFILVFAFTVSLYFLGEFLNNIVWGKELKLAKRKTK